MTWWQYWLIGFLSGDAFIVGVIGGSIAYVARHMDKFGPMATQLVMKRVAKRANSTSGITTG